MASSLADPKFLMGGQCPINSNMVSTTPKDHGDLLGESAELNIPFEYSFEQSVS